MRRFRFRINDDAIVIDHGPGAHWHLLETGIWIIDVSHVRPGRTLRTYGPTGLKHFVDRLFGPDGVFRLDFTARTNHPESLENYRERSAGVAADGRA